MPKCSGCSANIVTEDSGCIDFFGAGTLLSPLTANPIISSDGGNTLECREGGLYAAGGGGGSCAQKNVYTVATLGTEASAFFSVNMGTHEPFLSCADFLGDGTNDEVAIQAACNAAAPALAGFGLPIGAKVNLLPGWFHLQDGVNVHGVPIHGNDSRGSTVLWNNITDGFRYFQNTEPYAEFKDFTVTSFMGIDAAIYFHNLAGTAIFERINVAILDAGSGGDDGFFVFTNGNYEVRFRDCVLGAIGSDDPMIIAVKTTISGVILPFSVDGCSFTDGGQIFLDGVSNFQITGNTFQSNLGQEYDTGVFITAGNQISGIISDNAFYGRAIHLSGGIEDTIVSNNILNIPSTTITIDNPAVEAAIRLIMDIPGAVSRRNLISNNIIENVPRSGIIIDGIEDESIEHVVTGNNVSEYSWAVVGYIGILIQNNVKRCNIQANTCHTSNNAYGLYVGDATCEDNFVTNNDLSRFGNPGVAFTDSGTGTVTTAGNRV